MSDDLILRAKRTAVGLRTWDHPNEANLMEDLADEIRDLREQLEMREGLLLRAGRDNLRLHSIVEKVRRGVEDALDGAPDPRRVETAEDLDAAPTGQRNMWDGFCDDCECIHCKPMDSEPWHGKASS
ncbi:hypothetical protein ACLQ3K_25765 [Tsukamurella sp. DT100]|uniref:hypothetical protein n=1 Tax=Tsukamurella sp. DT100 TaxID=3393415 RepID=UPI003CEB181F